MPGRSVERIRIGEGAGGTDAWISPARDLALRGELDYLTFECLAERTIAFAQTERLHQPDGGYDPLLARRLEAVLGPCLERGTRIVSNMGAANPPGAARVALDVAKRLGLPAYRVAVVSGDDVLARLDPELRLEETGQSLRSLGQRVVSANVYLGSQPIVEALDAGANLVLTGRVADPALALSCLRHAFGWAAEDWPLLGAGTAIGHLMECGPQVTGGYFADPGRKDVPRLATIGSPIAECAPDGTAVITKLTGSGGQVSFATCVEQLLYEIHDPAAYLTPDVVADFSQVNLVEIGPDRVQVSGATGHERPERLKVSVGYRDGFIGEGQISYAGEGCVGRGRLAGEIVADRLESAGLKFEDFRIDLIGSDALGGGVVRRSAEPAEVRLRVAGRCASREQAQELGLEVKALWLAGPAGGGGAFATVREVIAMGSVYVPRDLVQWSYEVLTWPGR
jgi:acyclic terpene utilization AtuA family protein